MKKTAIVICALITMWTAGPVFASTDTGAMPNDTAATALHKTGLGTERAADATSYAAREKAAPELANFKGGHVAGIYIGGSTLAVVLLIVLLVVLL